MSLTTALLLLVAELAVATVLVVTTRIPAKRARRLVYAFGIFTGLAAIWAIGLGGTDEALNRPSSGGTWIAVGLRVINAIVFMTIQSARERNEYGSNPA